LPDETRLKIFPLNSSPHRHDGRGGEGGLFFQNKGATSFAGAATPKPRRQCFGHVKQTTVHPKMHPNRDSWLFRRLTPSSKIRSMCLKLPWNFLVGAQGLEPRSASRSSTSR